MLLRGPVEILQPRLMVLRLLLVARARYLIFQMNLISAYGEMAIIEVTSTKSSLKMGLHILATMRLLVVIGSVVSRFHRV